MPFSDLSSRLTAVRETIRDAVRRGGHGQDVTLVAVTKTHPAAVVQEVLNAGLGDVGENKMQEALAKQGEVGVELRWHLIGHLQRNKVKHLASFHLFHALDSSRLADSIENVFGGATSPVDVLVQVNVSGEESKGGFALGDLAAEADRLVKFKGLRVRGVMTMAPFDADELVLRKTFAGAREARGVLQRAGHEATELSMGMSGDFAVAVEEGATIVRLGTILFGER